MAVDRKDPRYIKALEFFDMSGLDESWGMPSDPHAREYLRFAAAYLAVSNSYDAVEYLEVGLRQYVGNKYQDAMRRDIYRIADRAKEAASDNDS